MRTIIKSKHSKQDPKKDSTTNKREIIAVDIRGSGEEMMTSSGVTNEERHHLIAEAAYYRAEQRRFAPGYELEDWLTAEAEIEMKLSGTDEMAKHIPKHA